MVFSSFIGSCRRLVKRSVGQLEIDNADPAQSCAQHSRHSRCYSDREEVPIRCRLDRRNASNWSLGFGVDLFGEQRQC